ncbi:MAG TPA: hypothetical protein VMW44_00280 [Candidatus Bathyarchaeia archaeon]|nr:hypothetical protein [Candidatus Bathyarchaeia archaeon]
MGYYKIEAWSEDTGYVKAKNKAEAIEKFKDDCCDEFMAYSVEKITKKDYYDETMLDEDED